MNSKSLVGCVQALSWPGIVLASFLAVNGAAKLATSHTVTMAVPAYLYYLSAVCEMALSVGLVFVPVRAACIALVFAVGAIVLSWAHDGDCG